VYSANVQSVDPVSVTFDGRITTPAYHTQQTRSKSLSPVVVGAKPKPFHVKCLPLIRADGSIADPFVVLMKAPEVKLGDIKKIELPYLSSTGKPGQVWLLHALNGKSLTLAAQHFLTDVVLPSFDYVSSNLRSLRSRDNTKTEHGIFMFDGEREQLDVFIQSWSSRREMSTDSNTARGAVCMCSQTTWDIVIVKFTGV